MRPWILLLTIFLVGNTVFSQSVFRFKGKGRRTRVERTIRTKRTDLARKVLRRLDRQQKMQNALRAIYEVHSAQHPTRIVGPNNYLKGLSRRVTGPQWSRIGKSGGYNGAHHIVTKSVIKQLGGSTECINNAPSVFHPLHNTKSFENMFHDHERQLQIYEQSGIKGIIIDFFERANAVSGRLGIPLYNDDVIHQALLEAELWAKHWNLKWE